MKKPAVFLILFLSVSLLWAQEVAIPSNMPMADGLSESDEEKESEPAKKKFRLKNRMLETSFANYSFNASNNFIAVGDILRDPFYMLWNIRDIIQDPQLIYHDPVLINIDDFFAGFKFDLDMAFKPLSLNFNWKDNWGFGLDIAHIEAEGNFSLSGRMFALREGKDTFGAGAAVFADVGIPLFFHYNNIKIKLRPAVYLPLVYTEPGITYTRKNVSNEGREGMLIEINYDMQIYSPLNMEEIQNDPANAAGDLQNNYWNILRENLGYDFGLGLEYPWNDRLDIGVDIVNIPVPFAMAKLNHYLQLQGAVSVDTSQIDIETIIENEGKLPDDFWDNVYDFPEEFQLEYGYNSNGKKLYRPFKTLFYGNFRPFYSETFALIPSLGFSINYLYPQPTSIEGGLSARFDKANMFITTLGINYNDRKWKNSVDFVFNFRASEFDFGLSLQSQNFVKSFKGAGLGVNFGLKFGW